MNKSIVRLAAAIGIAAAGVAQPTTGLAGGGGGCAGGLGGATASASSTTISKFTFSGGQACAFFVNLSGTVETDVLVFTSSGTVKESGQPTAESFTFVGITQVDFKNPKKPRLLVEAFGKAPVGTLQIDLVKLSSGSLTASVPVFDSVSGASLTASISLTWTGTGDVTTVKDSFTFSTSTFTIRERVDESFRDAQASGTVTLSNGPTNFAPNPSVSAQLASVKTADVTISKS